MIPVVHWSVFVCVCDGGRSHKQFWIVRYSTLMNERQIRAARLITLFFRIESVIFYLLNKLRLGVSYPGSSKGRPYLDPSLF